MRLNIICFVLAVAHLPAGARTPMDSARELVRRQIEPMFEGRSELYETRIEPRAQGALIRIESHVGGRRTGLYAIRLNGYTTEFPRSAPDVRPVERGEGHGELMLPLDWRKRAGHVEGLIRSLVRGDEALHPMNSPPAVPWKVTGPQRAILDQLHAQQAEAKAAGLAQRSLVLAPPGFGKTKLAGMFTRELEAADGQPQMIVYIVQNRDILGSALGSLVEVRENSKDRVHKAYGPRENKFMLEPGANLIGASRTVAHRDLPEFLRRTKGFKGRIVFVVDECQHIGKQAGEFSKILEALDRGLRPQDVLMGLTATPWHTDVGPIHRFFRNRIVTTHVTAKELELYLSSHRLIELARLVMFRHIAAGWSPPIYGYQQVEYTDEETGLPSRAFLNDYELEKHVPADAPDRRRKIVRIHEGFVDRILGEIRDTFQKVDGKLVYFNRGIVFVPSIVHAEEYAALLTARAPEHEKIEVRAYHSKMSGPERDAILKWYREGDSTHKYLVAIRTIGEGFDARMVNHIVLAKPYSAFDPVGMRELLQNIGRLSRISHGKWRTFVTDFTGDMRRLLFQDVDPKLVRSIFVEDGKVDLRQLPIQRVAEVTGKKPRPENFVTETLTVPIDELTTSEDQRNLPFWTLARTLLDYRLVPHLLPGAPFGGQRRSLGQYLCAEVNEQTPTARLQHRIVSDLMTALAWHPGDERALREACAQGIFELDNGLFANFRQILDDAESELMAKAPHVFSRKTFVDDDFLRGLDELPMRLNDTRVGQPNLWSRRWTLAELLIHPLIMPLQFAHLDAPNMGQVFAAEDNRFGEGGEELRKLVGPWDRPEIRAKIREAAALGLFPEVKASHVYDRKTFDRLVRALTSFDRDFFGQKTDVTDLDLWRMARKRENRGYWRARTRAFFVLGKLPAREMRDTPGAQLAKWFDFAKAVGPSTKARLAGDERLVEPGLQHLTARQSFLQLNHPEVLEDDSLHAKLLAHAEKHGPWRLELDNSLRTDVELPIPEHGWTLARLLLHPKVMTGLIDSPRASNRLALSNISALGYHLCRHYRKKVAGGIDSVSDYAEVILRAFDLDLDRWRQLRLEDTVRSACDLPIFAFRREKTEAALAELAQRERELIEIAPEIFGMKTRFVDADLKAGPTILARLPLVPRFDRPLDPEEWHRPWPLARVLANPWLAELILGEGRTNLVGSVLSGRVVIESLSEQDLEKLRGLLQKDGKDTAFQREFHTDKFDSDYGSRRLIGMQPDLMGQETKMNWKTFYELVRKPKVSRAIRERAQFYMISQAVKIPDDANCSTKLETPSPR